MERQPLTRDQFRELLRKSRQAFHLELRDTYGVASEDDPYSKWLRGEPDDYAWRTSWLDFMRSVTRSGVSVQRVRVVSEPHTDYTRWGLALAPQGIEAGEDIRYVPRQRVSTAKLPDEDFWLLDDDGLILSLFESDGASAGFARSLDPQEIEEYRAVRDELWALAVPFSSYAS